MSSERTRFVAWLWRHVIDPDAREDATPIPVAALGTEADLPFGGLAPLLRPTTASAALPPPLPPATASLTSTMLPIPHLVVPPIRQLVEPLPQHVQQPIAAKPAGVTDTAAQEPPATATGQIVWLRPPGPAPRLLALQIASATRLNCPTSRASRRKPPRSAVKAVPKAAPSAGAQLKPRLSSTGARLVKPARQSAEIIHLDRTARSPLKDPSRQSA